jgi:hypothetical protein
MTDKIVRALFYWVPLMTGAAIICAEFGFWVFFAIALIAFAMCVNFSDI